jgi:hypothetical protein
LHGDAQQRLAVPRPHIRAVHEKIRAFFCQLCRKSFNRESSLLRHEKSKQHQLRLMNGGGNDDFFFNNNNRQRTTDNCNEFVANVDNNNSRKTISMSTMPES